MNPEQIAEIILIASTRGLKPFPGEPPELAARRFVRQPEIARLLPPDLKQATMSKGPGMASALASVEAQQDPRVAQGNQQILDAGGSAIAGIPGAVGAGASALGTGGRAVADVAGEVTPRLFPAYTGATPLGMRPGPAQGGSGEPAATPPPSGNMYQDAAVAAAQKYGIDPNTFLKQIRQESGFNPKAVSPAGALGIAQIMPATARGWGVDPMDPMAALDAAARAMKQYTDAYGPVGALIAYNAGPGRANIWQEGGWEALAPVLGKDISQTRQYVASITGQTGDADRGFTGGTNPTAPTPPPPPATMPQWSQELKQLWTEYIASPDPGTASVLASFLMQDGMQRIADDPFDLIGKDMIGEATRLAQAAMSQRESTRQFDVSQGRQAAQFQQGFDYQQGRDVKADERAALDREDRIGAMQAKMRQDFDAQFAKVPWTEVPDVETLMAARRYAGTMKPDGIMGALAATGGG